MKIKLDENLPNRLAQVLSGLGHDVDTVIDEGLASRNDDVVWQAAQYSGRLLVTQDLDFSDVRKFQPGTHCGLVLVRLRDPSRTALVERVRGLFASQPVETWTGCFVVATEHKLRVRHRE
jgi:predicted nuclease of predicted toxin-antitoxin system